MSNEDIASQLLQLDLKWLQEFEVDDTFNSQQLRGYMSRKPDHRYGALVITHVNEEECPQIIWGTPKLHYPFDKQGKFNFPPLKKVRFYEKLDGTNVLAFKYQNAQGQSFISYKLRLTPIIRNTRYGNFLDMWNELLLRYPSISDLVRCNNAHMSFEMYGSRNSHLIQYEDALDVRLLFAIDDQADVIPVYKLNCLGVPVPSVIGQLETGQDPVQKYNELRVILEGQNKKLDDECFEGSEGAIWYVEQANDKVSLWKCKPESIEAIHWATGINKNAVYTTCINLLESSDVLNFDRLKELLLEEYSEEEIEDFKVCIEECIDKVNENLQYEEMVMEKYRQIGVSLKEDKGTVMRALSQQFLKEEMPKVFSIISKLS